MNMNISAEPVPEAAKKIFSLDMKCAGREVEDYKGRWFYGGPAVFVDESELQDVIRATSVQLQWDELGKSGLVIYPR